MMAYYDAMIAKWGDAVARNHGTEADAVECGNGYGRGGPNGDRDTPL
jgi:hypothetical protein